MGQRLVVPGTAPLTDLASGGEPTRRRAVGSATALTRWFTISMRAAGLDPERSSSRARAIAGLTGRAVMVVAGSAIVMLCYGLTIRATLGLGPLFAVQDGVASHLGISIGSAVTLVGLALVVVAVALRSWPGPGTLAVPFLNGAFLDLMLPHLPVIHGLVLRLAVVVGATWFMGLGGSLIIAARLGASAYDAVMMGLRKRVGGPIVVIRLGMETSMLILGWLLGGAIGIGTAITGLLIAPSMHFWLHLLHVTSAPAESEGDAAPARRRLRTAPARR